MRKRLDLLLLERGLAESRAKAQAIIRAGGVLVDGSRVDKPGQQVPPGAELVLRPRPPYVSRGGQKLAACLDTFGIDPAGLVCLDVGASTGGFTDVLLQRGALRVYAVDVGRAQLAWKLRTDPRVVCMERTDIRDVASLPEPIALATVDVAFISLRLVLPAVQALLAPDGQTLALIKPQFEAGRGQVPRGGVVRDPAVHRMVLENVVNWCTSHGWRVAGLMCSPLAGSRGNREFWAWLAQPDVPVPLCDTRAAIAAALADPQMTDS